MTRYTDRQRRGPGPINPRSGFANFGGILIPSMSLNHVLTDRGDGTRWFLSFTTTPGDVDGLGYITINDTLPIRPDQRVYRAFEEPYLIGQPKVRLFVRDGYLGMEVFETSSGQSQARIMARVGLLREGREIIIPAGWSEFTARGSAPGGELAWTVVEFANG